MRQPVTAMFFDSHCHLTDERLAAETDAVLERARAAGVTGVVTIASDADDAEAAHAIAQAHADVWSTAGIHPHAAHGASDDALERVRALVALPRVVAIGETGLDFYYDNAPRAAQRRSFEAHLALAADTGLPVVVHAREADDEVATMIRAAGPGVRGVLHCFASGPALLEAGLEAGWHVSFSGLVSFRSYDGDDLVRRVPANRLLIETDSPYLTPVPMRGKRNEPAFVAHVAEAVARITGETAEEVGARTARNARRFYGLEAG